MWDNATITMLLEGVRDTLYMTLASTFFGYVLGLPLGVILAVTDKDGIKPNAFIYKILDIIVNILRSIPFLILLILVIPITRAIVGKTYGSTATVVPLVIAAAPFIARMVESSLKEVNGGVIEAAQASGATLWDIIGVYLSEGLPDLIRVTTVTLISLIGETAMAGAVGAGGIGNVAIAYGFNRYNNDVTILATVVIVAIIFTIQFAGDFLTKKLSHK